MTNEYHEGYQQGYADAKDEFSSKQEDKVPRQLFFDFRDKLDKWVFDNAESVCGDNMIDIDYLDGHIFELFCELGIIRFDEEGNRID